MGIDLFLRLAGALIVSFCWAGQASAADVDAAVVFAVDVSASIDPDTADLQRNGHASALTSPEVISAITGNYIGCVSIVYFEWSSPGRTRTVLPWTKICGLQDAEAAARTISEKGSTGFRHGGRAGTSVSSAIDVASLFLDQFPGKANQRIIDISGNGENNDGLPVSFSRSTAIAKGYTINAIAIPAQDERPGFQLASYFAENVIGGVEAFVATPTGPNDYAVVLRRKLVTEIGMNDNP